VRFQDRSEAGKALAQKLLAYQDQPSILILALPLGGVPIAVEVAQVLRAQLDVFLVHPLRVPGYDELTLGAIATDDVSVLNAFIIESLNITDQELDAIVAIEQRELKRRERLYRGIRPFPVIRDRTILLIDDGLSTGATKRAAVLAIRRRKPSQLIIGVPVSMPTTCDSFRNEVDAIVCAIPADSFHTVDSWYKESPKINDDEVRTLLAVT